MRFLLLILIPILFKAQTVSTVTVTWSTGWCNICGPTTGNYACESGSGSGNWNNGVRTFMDPTPINHTICGVSIEVQKVDCGITSMCVLLNTATVQCQPITLGSNCSCGSCWPQTYQRVQCPFPNYVKGGMNTLDLNPVGNVCVSSAIITIYSNTSCVSPCIMMLPIEIYGNQEIKNELEIIKPKILEIYDMNGNKYKDTIPSNLNGILIIRYKDGTYKKTHIN